MQVIAMCIVAMHSQKTYSHGAAGRVAHTLLNLVARKTDTCMVVLQEQGYSGMGVAAAVLNPPAVGWERVGGEFVYPLEHVQVLYMPNGNHYWHVRPCHDITLLVPDDWEEVAVAQAYELATLADESYLLRGGCCVVNSSRACHCAAQHLVLLPVCDWVHLVHPCPHGHRVQRRAAAALDGRHRR
jgi:hypothetical protein